MNSEKQERKEREREREIGLEREGEGEEKRKRKITVWGSGSFLNFVTVFLMSLESRQQVNDIWCRRGEDESTR